MENFNLIFIVDRRSLEKVHHIKTMYVLPFSIYVTIIIKVTEVAISQIFPLLKTKYTLFRKNKRRLNVLLNELSSSF